MHSVLPAHLRHSAIFVLVLATANALAQTPTTASSSEEEVIESVPARTRTRPLIPANPGVDRDGKIGVDVLFGLQGLSPSERKVIVRRRLGALAFAINSVKKIPGGDVLTVDALMSKVYPPGSAGELTRSVEIDLSRYLTYGQLETLARALSKDPLNCAFLKFDRRLFRSSKVFPARSDLVVLALMDEENRRAFFSEGDLAKSPFLASNPFFHAWQSGRRQLAQGVPPGRDLTFVLQELDSYAQDLSVEQLAAELGAPTSYVRSVLFSERFRALWDPKKQFDPSDAKRVAKLRFRRSVLETFIASPSGFHSESFYCAVDQQTSNLQLQQRGVSASAAVGRNVSVMRSNVVHGRLAENPGGRDRKP